LLEVSIEPIEDWQEVVASTVDNLESVWRWGKEKSSKQRDDLAANLGKDGNIRIFQKERKLSQTAKTTWDNKNFHSIKGTRELTEILGKSIFDFPKPENLIRQILRIGTNENDIVLDSFAGSGTTAHAVLNLNKEDEGNRKFILIEMEDYANTITAERTKRVMDGYGEGTKATNNTGGDFSYYELGKPLFLDEDILNEEAGEENIKKYVWFSETKSTYKNQEEAYLLGTKDATAYYFYYIQDSLTTLDESFLRNIKTKAEQYIIYADNCLLDDNLMQKYHIIFKKIPRDITRF